MRAIEVPAFGSPDVLAIVDRAEPEPGPGELLLRVVACGLNFADLHQREGTYVGGPVPPYIAGQEAAGEVIAHGPGVSFPPLGARVAAIAATGLFAERAVVRATACAVIPGALSFEEGAALLASLLTAGHALETVGRARAGETVLIHAAAGGLGTIAVQLAARLGLRTIATASSPDKRARVAALGADVVCGYEEFPDVARRETAGRGPDLVLEVVGGDVFQRSLAILPPLGRLVLVGVASGRPGRIDPVKLLFRSQAVLGFHLSAVLTADDRHRAAMERWLAWVDDGTVRPQVGHVMPLSDVARAHQLLASRTSFGKIVLTTAS